MEAAHVTQRVPVSRQNPRLPRPSSLILDNPPGYSLFIDPLSRTDRTSTPRRSPHPTSLPADSYTGPLPTAAHTIPAMMLINAHDTATPVADNTLVSDIPPLHHLNQLHETVSEVLDASLQHALPSCGRCGPTPSEYSSTLDSFWPVLSGETWNNYKDYANIYTHTRESAVPNFLANPTRVPSNLNIQAWRKYLLNYPDKTLVDMLEFGFPANYIAPFPPTPTYVNHREAQDHSAHIDQYVQKELTLGALLGPFGVPPMTPWYQCSPIMTREKTNSSDRRIIVDLSHPKGASVNSGIPRREYLGEPQSYTLPAVSNVADRIRSLGTSAYIWSADVSRAYRQLRADPLSTALFGITVGGAFYVDVALPFGCHTSGAACVRVTEAICNILRKEGYNALVYVDDFIGVEPSYELACKAFSRIIELCQELGFDLAPNKCTPPTPNIVWLGFYISVQEMMISIPKQKLEAILRECES